MFQYLLYRIAHVLTAHLPLGLCYWIAKRNADLHFLFSIKSRRQILRNLQWIDQKRQDIHRHQARMTFQNFGKNLVDFLALSQMNQREFLSRVKVSGLEHVQEAFQKKKGVIGVTAHIGNWEWGGVGLSFLGFPVHVLVLNHVSRRVNEFFVNQRVQKGLHVISMTSSVWVAAQVLAKNEMLLIAADRDFSNNGVPVTFLGRKVYFPRGPAAFSRRHGSPLVPGFVIRRERENEFFDFVFKPPIQPERTGDIASDLQRMTQKVASNLEEVIRHFPTQWFLFQGLRESP